MARINLQNISYKFVHKGKLVKVLDSYNGQFQTGACYKLERGLRSQALVDILIGRLKSTSGKLDKVPCSMSYSMIGYFDGSERSKVQGWFKNFGKKRVFEILNKYCSDDIIQKILREDLENEDRVWIQCLDVFFKQRDILVIRDERHLPYALLKDYPAIKLYVA